MIHANNFYLYWRNNEAFFESWVRPLHTQSRHLKFFCYLFSINIQYLNFNEVRLIFVLLKSIVGGFSGDNRFPMFFWRFLLMYVNQRLRCLLKRVKGGALAFTPKKSPQKPMNCLLITKAYKEKMSVKSKLLIGGSH